MRCILEHEIIHPPAPSQVLAFFGYRIKGQTAPHRADGGCLWQF